MDTETLKNIIENAGFPTRPYSGRGMYGKSCIAVSLDSDRDALKFVAQVVASVADDIDIVDAVTNAFDHVQTDSMGRGVIVYFPRLFVQVQQGE